MEKFKKNDLVVVIDNGKICTTYETFVRNAKEKDKTIKLKNWMQGKLAPGKFIYKVIYTEGIHTIIEDSKKDFFVIENAGIKHILKYGDVVEYEENGKLVRACVRDKSLNNKVGEIFDINQSILTESIEYHSWMHNGDGTMPDGYGWYKNFLKIERLDDLGEQPKSEVEIVDDIHNKQLDELKETIQEQTKIIKKLTDDISRKERMQDILNEAVIEKAKDIAVEDMENHLKENLDKFIEKKYGILPKKIELITETTKKELTGIFHKEFENICRIVKADIPLMLVGSAGAGKNYTLEQVAEALDLDFYFSNAVNQEYKLTGFIDANGTYHETQFYQAFTKGGMFFLDEIDASCPECLVILNSAIANRYFDFPTGRVKAHENFRVVCAGNTYGTGADMVYVGRNVLDGATLDRFVVLQFDYDEQVEKQLAFDDTLYSFIKALRNAINEANLRYIVSMRALINATKLLELGVDKLSILKTTIIKNMQIDDLNTIVSKVSKTHISEWTDCLKRMCDNVGN